MFERGYVSELFLYKRSCFYQNPILNKYSKICRKRTSLNYATQFTSLKAVGYTRQEALQERHHSDNATSPSGELAIFFFTRCALLIQHFLRSFKTHANEKSFASPSLFLSSASYEILQGQGLAQVHFPHPVFDQTKKNSLKLKFVFFCSVNFSKN